MKRRALTVTIGAVVVMVVTMFSLRQSGIAEASVIGESPQEEYAVIRGVTGESSVFPGAFDVQSLSFSVTDKVDITSQFAGGAVSKPLLGEISFTKAIDSATTQLLGLETQGKVVTGDIYFGRRVGSASKAFTYYDLHFTGIITADEQSDSSEQIAIQPEEVNISYRPMNLDGTASAPQTWGYSALTGTTS